jgi:hypothetical protein
MFDDVLIKRPRLSCKGKLENWEMKGCKVVSAKFMLKVV